MLLPHSAAANGAVKNIDVRIGWTSPGNLSVIYRLEGNLGQMRIPSAKPPRFADELWRHTCFELFVARDGATGYEEFNFSPSGEWAVYAFSEYRQRVSISAEILASLHPRIAVRQTEQAMELEAVVELDRLSPCYREAKILLGLSAVIEAQTGALSYWALKHPSPKPDFHHREGFALELNEVRH